MSRIFLSRPDVTESEAQRAVAAIRSGWVAPLGPEVDAFELDMATRLGRQHAVALSSGTAALHLALVSWGVGPGDYIPTSTLTFAATANAISYTGATPVFVDSLPDTGNIDPDLLDTAITSLKADGKNVPVIVPVDLLGKCADYGSIRRIATDHGVRILSDAAESLGASSGAIKAGGFGDVAVLSFNGNKVMTTSGGGMLLTDDEPLADHVRHLATQAREPAVHYEHKEIGYNYRLSNISAAIGRAQLERLDEMIKRRRAHREMYADLFSDAQGVEIFGRAGDEHDNCWLTAVIVDPEAAAWTPNQLMDVASAQDIETRPLWKPMHRQPVYEDRPAYISGAAEMLFDRGLALPSGSVLTDQETARVLTCFREFVGGHR